MTANLSQSEHGIYKPLEINNLWKLTNTHKNSSVYSLQGKFGEYALNEERMIDLSLPVFPVRCFGPF